MNIHEGKGKPLLLITQSDNYGSMDQVNASGLYNFMTFEFQKPFN